ncbi:hypothetical protein F5X99DRAFT_420860 [Biscogniauxia marginata]|nr:hypothetical protein F5X99DRAFT_420860 [Biscogniauxia marginata]
MAPPKARARFQADLKAAAEMDIPNVLDVKKGDVEEEFTFSFDHQDMDISFRVHVMLQDLAGYPGENIFLVYTMDDVPAGIAKELEESMDKTAGMRIVDMLNNLSRRLRSCLEPTADIGDSHSTMSDHDSGDNDTIYMDEGDESDEGDVPFEYGDEYDFGLVTGSNGTSTHEPSRKTAAATLKRIRRDFCTVRDAGFKLGRLCGFDYVTEHSIVSTSVRVDKLGLSEETREAWNLSNADYIVLLIQYTGDYSTYESVMERPAENSRLKFRLRKCSKYRPTLQQAMAALSSESSQRTSVEQNPVTQASAGPEFSLLGIGESIDMFLDKDFIPMMKLRKQEGVSWDTAKKMHSELIKSLSSGHWAHEDPNFATNKDSKEQDDGEKKNEVQLPPILASDHLFSGSEISLPLVATQFALRYLVRCTDYCMICHEKVTGNFEALKPYVCGNSLCLFQYMNLGFGPSIDQEIISQPFVVDLLISFCYSSLSDDHGNPRIREFPTGLSLLVPDIHTVSVSVQPGQPSNMPPQFPNTVKINNQFLINPTQVTLDWEDSTVTFHEDVNVDGWREGRWVIVCTPLNPTTTSDPLQDQVEEYIVHHGRIEWKIKQLIKLHIASRHMIPLHKELIPDAVEASADARYATGYLLQCDQNLDDLSDADKAFSMTMLLASLPSVTEMRSYLMGSQSRKLATWDRMTPAAMTLLRWIIASNRSYIVQVDQCPGQGNDTSTARLTRHHERISGVDGWIQFRFAQGSPEKEALFREALEKVDKPQRTLVAWHGSPLGNWHSIVRHGLDYSVAANGRAYGNGVYFSRNFDYSMHYVNPNGLYQVSTWPQSELKINGAMSLSELVNLPNEFIHNQNCFVVQHCHWIQCRYLFVRPSMTLMSDATQGHRNKGVDEFIQDPKWVTGGAGGKRLHIPRIAIPSAQNRTKATSLAAVTTDDGEQLAESEDEDIEDISFLFDDEDVQSTSQTNEDSFGYSQPGLTDGLPPTPNNQEPQTDFRPGTLDFSNLPQLAPPSYATESAQRTIGREMKKLQKIQSTTPLHELGWYIDFEKVNNMFQWIVELHSFDADLPLAKDMKVAGITSIVIEIRFLREFPISPPFVRVIGPRFLPFMNGGGGHVTSGGAMCMELLTNTGWSPANSMESVLLQVRMALCNLEPTPARLQSTARGSNSQYGVSEAIDAYIRAATAHQWEVPKDLLEASMEMRA